MGSGLMGQAALAEHRDYLADGVRNRAFEAALAAVSRDAVVLDLGCGTGLWGMVALRHGARRVYAVEGTGMIDWAKAVARRNGAGDRIVHVRGWSREIDLPEQVDVVVCDQIGQFILEGDAIGVLADAAARHLRPGGTMIPRRLDYWAALSRSQVVEDALGFWTGRPEGFDFEPVRQMALGSRWYDRPDPTLFAAPPIRLGTVVPGDFKGNLVEFGVTQGLVAAGSANALLGWFDAELAPGVTITNGPPSPSTINRHGVALPLSPDLSWEAGETCAIEIAARIGTGVLSWSARCGTEDRRSSTLAGSLTGAADIRRARDRLS
jgi:protein arginine N-methyltransferase 1